MNANLKQFYKLDPGFAQFVDRHGLVAADPKVRRDYDLWLLDQALWAEELEEMRANYEARGKAKGEAIGEAIGKAKGEAIGKAIGEAIGKAIGKAKGEAKRDMEIALKAFRLKTSDADWLNTTKILRELDIPEDTIESAQAQVKAERDKPAIKKVKVKKRPSEKS